MRGATVVFAWVVLATCCLACSEKPKTEPAKPREELEAPVRYVGTETCATCHGEAHDEWLGSHHELAMQEATPETVLGDFGNIETRYFSERARFSRRDDSFFVSALGADGQPAEFPVRYTFGAVPLQQYLVETEPGRLQAFPFAWDTRDRNEGGQRWFHLQPDEYIEPGDPLHWTGIQFNWNNNCADCHSTRLIKNYDRATRRYDTTFEETNVGCEACHGPGSAHVEAAKDNALSTGSGFDLHLATPEDRHWEFVAGRDIAVLKVAGSTDEVTTCAPCHSRRADLGDAAHGFHNRYRLATLDERLYFDDGQIKDEVFVLGSFLQSKMHAAGVVCSDCHESHGTGLRAEGNALCTRCHKASVYDEPSHTMHAVGTEGSRCTDCHMPKRTYMVIDDRGDHRFDVPRPALSARIGSPDPCTACHTDKTAAWAERQIERRFDERSEHPFAEALHAARRQEPGAEALLVALVTNGTAPDLARATALLELRNMGSRALPALLMHATDDASPVVRRSAAVASRALPPEIRREVVVPLLSDGVLSVRVEAVASLLGAGSGSVRPADREAFQRAAAEYGATRAFVADRGEGLVDLANLAAVAGDVSRAETVLREALEVDPTFTAGHVNLADLYRGLGRQEESEKVLRQALSVAADRATVEHALGLALVRLDRHDEALVHLSRAYALRPEYERFGYVYAIAAFERGRTDESLRVLETLHRRYPANADFLQLLVT
ncbi:MAG: tetratricopeptide repeat protein, partial [Myxococcota bacterium]